VYNVGGFIIKAVKMTTTTLTINVPKTYVSDLRDTVFEQYLNEFIVDYIEAKNDKLLIKKLSKNKKFADLASKLDESL